MKLDLSLNVKEDDSNVSTSTLAIIKTVCISCFSYVEYQFRADSSIRTEYKYSWPETLTKGLMVGRYI